MQVFLVLSAAFHLLAAAQAAHYFIAAPNIVRVDVNETILVSVHGTDADEIPVTLYFHLAGSNNRISERTVIVTENEPQVARLSIERSQLPQRPTRGREFVTLVASSSSPLLTFQNQQVILMSYQASFVFIQTDKPLYTPNQRVDIRVVALNQDMAPANHELQVDIMSPDKITVYRKQQRPDNGFLILQFDVPEHPVLGNWTVTTRYGHLFNASTSVQFEVKEYVLPKFYVEVSTQSMYIVPGTPSLVSKVKAKYLFGEPVVGNYYVRYGVFTDDGSLMTLQSKEGQLDDEGQRHQSLDLNNVALENWTKSLMGKRLIIQAFVTDSASGETVNANNTMVTFCRTPFKFNWDLIQRYFKRKLPFSAKVNVQFLNGLPARNIPVIASPRARLQNGNLVDLVVSRAGNAQDTFEKVSGPQGEVDFRLDVPSDATQIEIRLRTNDPTLVNANFEDSITIQPQDSTNNEFMALRIPHIGLNVRRAEKIDALSSVEVQLTNEQNVDTLNFFVIAGGRIVHRDVSEVINQNIGLLFTVTHDMAPSARVVAYYIRNNGHVIADALLIDVEKKCKNHINMSIQGLPVHHNTYRANRAGQNVELEIQTAWNETNVGLLAVDEAVFKLRNYHRLTQKKVFMRMVGYDLGCGPGGGQTTASILKDAGLAVMTNANVNVPQREAVGCPDEHSRVRRTVNDTEKERILSKYDGVEREYCQKGLRNLPESHKLTCAQRAKLMAARKGLNGASPEITAFYECCTELESVSRGRADARDGKVNLEKIFVRWDFPESWLFDNVTTSSYGNGVRALYPITLPHSVTTWVIEAVGVSASELGLCVADPIKVEVRPLFFLDLGMPYSVQRFEQIEIVASVFNYADDDLEAIFFFLRVFLRSTKVTIYLAGKEGLCSVAQPGEYSEGITFTVASKKPASVKYVIVPMEVKDIPIEVVAESGQYSDAVKKTLIVRPEGYETKVHVPVTLDPVNTRELGRDERRGPDRFYRHTQQWGNAGEANQVDTIEYKINRDAIPGTHRARMSVIGTVMGNAVDTVITGLERLLRIPSGCGEQTISKFAPNVYIYTYLKHSNQFTPNLEASIQKYIRDGITNELRFRRPDGSFSLWGTDESKSTWLTAFVARILCKAKEFAAVDNNLICEAMIWLATQIQPDQNGGFFRELYEVNKRGLGGGVHDGTPLTAFILLSFLECECDTFNKINIVRGATDFLEDELPGLTRPYAIAITAYALALADSDRAQDAIETLKGIATYDADSRYWAADDSSFGAGRKPYWYVGRPKAIEVETTSYALLALLTVGDIPYTHAIVNWLTNQENYDGGFASTQDTVVALHALSVYSDAVQQDNTDIRCHVTCDKSGFNERFKLNPGSALVRQQKSINVPEISEDMTVVINSGGSGLGRFQFEATYYLPEPNRNDSCDFELQINQGDTPQADHLEDNDEEYFSYDVQVSYLRGERTGMAILDVGLFTGYVAVEEDLKQVMENSNGTVQQYEATDRAAIFYLAEISGQEATRIQFRARRKFKVGKIQPVAVRVYDYYNPTEDCVRFLGPKEGSSMLAKLCDDNTCICAEGNCSGTPKKTGRDYNVYELKTKACVTKSHFAFKVRVNGEEEKGNFQLYTLKILTPLKKGLDNVEAGDKRIFMKTKTCDTPHLKNIRDYLVIGSRGLPMKGDGESITYKYYIDEKMVFYEWPVLRDLQIRKWERISQKLQNLQAELEDNIGCAT
ncbi:complement C3-like [Acanthaster planci]|uniref:Complement C3-like n=1 Tax=Acanthaster planci TaxID=133434 RepID=A0A8B7ZD97_ACAPL|nr:complement C3-like [Acanthaster planci]